MKLPVISGSEAVKAFQKTGYEFGEQNGSRIILRTRRSAAQTFRFEP